MKRRFLTILLLLLCTHINSTEFQAIFIDLGRPRNIRSNSAKTFELTVDNRGNTPFRNLELSTVHSDDLLVNLDITRIDSLEPGGRVRINMEVINNHTSFFDEQTTITVTVSNEDHNRSFHHRFTIKPVENFWLFVILTLTLIVICLFILIYVKASIRGKNAG